MSRTTTTRSHRCPPTGTQSTEAAAPKVTTMTNNQVAEGDTCHRKAIGFVRGDVSRLAAPRHASAVMQHARLLGYQYVYTVRPPQDTSDPIGYVLGIAAGLDVAAIVVYD